jgi:hypothetical protein
MDDLVFELGVAGVDNETHIAFTTPHVTSALAFLEKHDHEGSSVGLTIKVHGGRAYDVLRMLGGRPQASPEPRKLSPNAVAVAALEWAAAAVRHARYPLTIVPGNNKEMEEINQRIEALATLLESKRELYK